MDAREEVVKAICEAIKIPNLFQIDDLMEVAIVKQLEKDTLHGKLYQLLSIFVSESLDIFQNFASTNSEYLKSLGEKKKGWFFF